MLMLTYVVGICICLTSSVFAQTITQPTIGARPAALGATYIALADDGYAAYWNPAGLPALRHHEFNTMRADLFGTGFLTSYLSYALPFTDRYGIAVDWVNQGFDDDELTYSQNRVGFATGARLTDWLSVGGSAKWHRFDAGLDGLGNPIGFSSEGTGWGFDAGVLLAPLPGVKVGVVAQDITGTEITYDNGLSQPLYPFNLRLGIAYALNRQLLLSSGLDDSFRLGAEYRVHPTLVLRGGLHRDLDQAEGLFYAFGAGVRHQFVRVDYAYTQTPDLGGTHRFSLGLAFNLTASAIKIQDLQLQPVFPALQKRYLREPLGTVKLTNTSRKPLAANVSLYIPTAMDAPTEFSEPVVLAPGSEQIDLFALFGSQLSDWPRNRILGAEIQVAYTEGDRTRSSIKQGQVTVYNSNAVQWETIGAAAAFVTPDDAAVAAFARGVLQPHFQEIQQGGEASQSLLSAMLMFNAVSQHGVRYLADPNNPYEKIAGQDFIVDSIQYPAELLQTRTGDCDDCTVLYCSLLENVGISTTLIDAPNHILMAFDTGVSRYESQSIGLPAGHYLVRDGRLWIPVEVTLFGGSFHEAWRTAVEECLQLENEGRLAMVDTRNAWDTYPPSPPHFAAKVVPPATIALWPLFDLDWQALHRTRKEFLRQEYLEPLEEGMDSQLLQEAFVYNLVQLGEYEQALLALDERAGHGLHQKALGNNRAIIFLLQGDTEKAKQLWERLLALFPEDEDIKNNLQIAQTRIFQPGEGRSPISDENQAGQKSITMGLTLKDLHWK